MSYNSLLAKNTDLSFVFSKSWYQFGRSDMFLFVCLLLENNVSQSHRYLLVQAFRGPGCIQLARASNHLQCPLHQFFEAATQSDA